MRLHTKPAWPAWAAVLFAIGTSPATACEMTAPTLSADRTATGIHLSWTGVLDPGESWTIYEGSLDPVDPGSPIQVGLSLPDFDIEPRPSGTTAYLVLCQGPAGDGPPSNMAFHLERSFPAFVGRSTPLHLLSLPNQIGIGDVANTGGAEWNKCVGDSDGPAAGDGQLNADDVLCTIFTDRAAGPGDQGAALHRYDRASGIWRNRGAVDQPGEGVVFAGRWTEALLHEGFMVATSQGQAPAIDNRAVIVGAHQPNRPCQRLEPVTVLSVPYNVLYWTANDLLCGVPGVDWGDDDGDGNPDQCRGGLFDSVSGGLVTVQSVTPDGVFVGRTVGSVGDDLYFLGTDFDLHAGEAYIATFEPSHPGGDFCPPTYPY